VGKALLKFSAIERLYRAPPYYANAKVKARCDEVGIKPPAGAPIDNNVICWRLPDLTMSKGGIVIPGRLRSPNIKGILIACGPRARDVLYSNGTQEGDIVTWARFSGWEHEDTTATGARGDMFTTLKDRDILQSDDLAVDLATGKAKYVLNPSTGRHELVRKLLSGKKQKLLALAASTTSPHEAETALRIAAEQK
jgi:co-chaperonin GroES (HSP10)